VLIKYNRKSMEKWIQNDQPQIHEVKELNKVLKIPQFICSLLLQRKIYGLDDARQFFRPNLELLHNPFLMKDMEKVVKRIQESSSEKIMILGDYDVDGTTSTAMLFKYFKLKGFDVICYIPDRYQEGYGVSINAIMYAEQKNISLIITVDCGIKAIDPVNLALSKKIDVIICDHHLPGNKIPDALGILNPKQSDCNYPFKDLCGCGIAFKLITAHNSVSSYQINIFDFLDFVALATVSDMMPLVDENRLMVFHGLKVINSNPRVGLRNFLNSISSKIDESKISFNIGPRINAAGRMKNGKIIVDLLIEEDIDKANRLSNEVEFLNQNRRRIEKVVFEDAEKQIDFNRYTNVVYSEKWSQGVLGIVASRLIEKSYKPTIVMTKLNEDLFTGSVRSVKGFDVYKALSKCKEKIYQFGGHKYAAGLKVKKSNFTSFKEKFEKVVEETVKSQMFERVFSYDLEITFSDLTIQNAKIIMRMAPFGLSNNKPMFRTNNCSLSKGLVFVGKNSQIVKSIIKDQSGEELPFVCFDRKDRFLNIKEKFNILYTINVSSYSAAEQVELILKEIN